MRNRLDGQLVRSRVNRAAREAARGALETLAAASRDRTPRATRRRRASCRAELGEDGTSGRVRYTAPYAAARHEREDSGAGFLARACGDPAVRASLQREMQRAFERELR